MQCSKSPRSTTTFVCSSILCFLLGALVVNFYSSGLAVYPTVSHEDKSKERLCPEVESRGRVKERVIERVVYVDKTTESTTNDEQVGGW